MLFWVDMPVVGAAESLGTLGSAGPKRGTGTGIDETPGLAAVGLDEPRLTPWATAALPCNDPAADARTAQAIFQYNGLMDDSFLARRFRRAPRVEDTRRLQWSVRVCP